MIFTPFLIRSQGLKKIAHVGLSMIVSLTVWSSASAEGGDDTLSAASQSSHQTLMVRPKLNASVSQQVRLVTPPKTKFRFSGFVRIAPMYRNMSSYYDITPTAGGFQRRGFTYPISLTLEDGAAQPIFMLRSEANFTASTYVILEAGYNNALLRSVETISSAGGKLGTVWNMFNFEGSTSTKFAKIRLVAGGGTNWFKLSPFTLWNFQYRDDMFERYPWDQPGNNWARYNSYYATGDIPRDLRWGNRAVQGFVVELTEMPFKLSSTLMYGKNQFSGGYNNFETFIPQNIFAGKVNKHFGLHRIGVNYFTQFGFDTTRAVIDTAYYVQGNKYQVWRNKTSQTILTGDIRLDLPKVRIYGEFGAGSYLSGTYFHKDTIASNWEAGKINRFKRPWSPLLYAEFDAKRSLIGFPFKLSAYYLGQHAVNNVSAFSNSSIEEVVDGRNYKRYDISPYNVTYWEGMITEIGQLTNNRKGFDLTTSKQIKKFSVNLGISMQQEIVNNGADTTLNGGRAGVRNSITYYHLTNQFQRSRFMYNQRLLGPYGRLQSDFRRTWENVAITDTIVDYKKGFSVIDFGTKYKTTVFKRELIVSIFGRHNSVSDNSLPLPVFSDKAFIRQDFAELMAFYKIHRKVSVLGFVALEQVKGNMRTELADSTGNLITEKTLNPTTGTDKPTYSAKGRPIDQRGLGYGIGLDYDYASNASVSIRYRHYEHKDVNFIKDKFKGYDVSVELKIYF